MATNDDVRSRWCSMVTLQPSPAECVDHRTANSSSPKDRCLFSVPWVTLLLFLTDRRRLALFAQQGGWPTAHVHPPTTKRRHLLRKQGKINGNIYNGNIQTTFHFRWLQACLVPISNLGLSHSSHRTFSWSWAQQNTSQRKASLDQDWTALNNSSSCLCLPGTILVQGLCKLMMCVLPSH